MQPTQAQGNKQWKTDKKIEYFIKSFFKNADNLSSTCTNQILDTRT